MTHAELMAEFLRMYVDCHDNEFGPMKITREDLLMLARRYERELYPEQREKMAFAAKAIIDAYIEGRATVK
jgi:hypothetical protein